MLFGNLTPLDGRFVNAIVICQKSECCEYITSLHIQHSIYVRQFVFFVFTMKQIAPIFCNVSFARQYRYIKKMPLANRSSSLLTNHGNHGNRTDNSSLPLYRKFRFRQASDFDWDNRDAQNRHRCWTMQDKKAECLRRKMYL